MANIPEPSLKVNTNDCELNYEIVNGRRAQLDVKPPAAIALVGLLAAYLTKAALGGTPGVPLLRPLIQFEPNELRRPDLAFYFLRRERTNELGLYFEDPSRVLTLVPDIAIETIIPTTTVGFINERTFRYLGAGVKLVWHLFLDLKRVHVFDSPKKFVMLDESDTLEGGNVLPGFSMPVADIFIIPNAPS